MNKRICDLLQSSIFGNRLRTHNISINNSIKKISSGYRINCAGDDAAGLAISERIRSKYLGTRQACKNVQNAVSLFQTADGGLETDHDVLHRMHSLAIQSANGTLTNSDREALQAEYSELKKQLTYTAYNTKHNHIGLLGPEKKSDANIVFLFDDSGSCAPEIGNVKNTVAAWVNDLKATFESIKIGVLSYADNAVIESNLTTDVNNVENVMANIAGFSGSGGAASGCGEFVYNAINTAVNNIAWDIDADKFIICLTDDGAEDEEVPNNVAATRENVLNNLINNNIFFCSIDPGGDVSSNFNWAGEHFVGPTTTYDSITYNGNQEYQYLTDATNGIRGDFTNITNALDTIKNNLNSNGGSAMGELLTFQVGPDVEQKITCNLPFDARIANLNIYNSEIDSQSNAEAAITDIKNAINIICEVRSKTGAAINTFEKRMDFLKINEENYRESFSYIRETDIASEMVKLTKNQILNNTTLSLTSAQSLCRDMISKLIDSSLI